MTRAALGVGAAGLAGWLGWVLIGLRDRPVDLPTLVDAALADSGVENPVTAVLLNFRAYDTLLEVAVLLVVAAALWALDPRETVAGADAGTGVEIRDQPGGRARAEGEVVGEVVGALVRVVVPLILVTGAYLAWTGSRLPGGAFQAGALLGGGGVLLMMAGRMRLQLPPALWLRAGLVSGFAVFLLVGAGALASGAAFLQYPPGAAYGLILAVEAVLTVSIAFVLIALFAEVPTLARPARAPELAKPPDEGDAAAGLGEGDPGTDPPEPAPE